MRIRIAPAILAAIACALLSAGCENQTIENISPGDAVALIRARAGDPDFVILDVRTPEEFTGGHIRNAVNLDYRGVDFRDRLDALTRNKTYLVYCMSCKRSSGAVVVMGEMRFENVYNLEGGFTAFREAPGADALIAF